MNGEPRSDRLATLVADAGLDQLLVGDLVHPSETGREDGANLRWLTGFTGSSGLALVGAEERLFFTDFRYMERAEREVAPEFERVVIERGLIPDSAKRLRGRVGYDDAKTSVKNHAKLLEIAPDGVELVAVTGLVERLRRHKDAWELEAIAKAARITDQVYEWIYERGVVGRTEREIMLDAHQRMRELGAEDPSFPAIVAAGENSALPHHDSSDREVKKDEFLLIDMGAIVNGYCSDCTRTVATGELDDEAREVYEVVRSAQVGALDGDPCRNARDRGRRRRPRRDHRRRLRRRVRPRAGAWGGDRGPRGAAPLQALRGDARCRRRGDGRAGRVSRGPLRRPHRGPGDGHRQRLPQPQRRRQGPASRRLAILVAELAIRVPSVEALFDAWSAEPMERRPLSDEARERILEAVDAGPQARDRVSNRRAQPAGLGAP